jgi:hypothetical protein
VAELADALDSKSSARKGVEVQVLSPVLAFWAVSVKGRAIERVASDAAKSGGFNHLASSH